MSEVRISRSAGEYLLRLRGCRGMDVCRGGADFEVALEAYERGWCEAKTAKDEVGAVIFLHIFGLSAAGHAVADAYAEALHDAQPAERAKRAGLFLASKLWELLLASLGSGVLGGVLGYLLRMLQEG